MLARQAASAEVLKAISTSPDDTRPVFELIARRGRQLCGAARASVTQLDGALLHMRARDGYDEATALLGDQDWPRPPGPETVHGRAVLTGAVIHVHDVLADDAYAQSSREVMRRLGSRSLLGVPLLHRGRAIGAITLGRMETGGFDGAQIDLVRSFAEQAVIAIITAATHRELQARTEALAQRNSEYGERIEHQAATIDVLKAMSASPGDPQPVFDLIAIRARDLCDAYGAGVYELDGTLVHRRAGTGLSDDPTVRKAAVARYPRQPTRDEPAGRAILDRRIIRFDDLGSEPDLNPVYRHLTVKSMVAIPLMRGDVAIGALALGSRERGGFSNSQLELLKTFAEQAVIAITSAETYRALQARTTDLQVSLQYQTATSDVLSVISRSTFDLKPVLETLLSIAMRLCGADFAMISQRQDDGFRVLATRSASVAWAASLEGRLLSEDRGSVTGRAVLAKRPVQIDDAAADPDYTLSGAVAVGQTRSCLGVPLLRDGMVVGAIALARQRVEPFTERQIELVSTFADQAVIAIENTRLLTEQQEALEQQTATAEVLQVINASPGDLVPVFEAMLEKATQVCGADAGVLCTFDGECFVPVALRGFEEFPRDRIQPHPQTGIGRLARGETMVHILDSAAGEAYQSGDPGRRAIVHLGGARTQLAAALRQEGRLIGSLTLWRREVRAFSDKQIALLQNFAAQAVIAMENARLLTEQREALEQQTAMAEVLGVINASPGNLDPVFEAILERAMYLCQAAFGGLWMFVGDRYVATALRGVPDAYAGFLTRNTQLPGPGSAPYRFLHGERSVLQNIDLTDDELYRTGNVQRRALVDIGGARTALHAPLHTEAALGVITLYRKEVRPFTEKQAALLQNFAGQAVIAMENARLLDQLRARTEELAQRQSELRITFENMGDGVALFDESSHLVAWNRHFQAMFSLPVELLEQRGTYEEYLRFLATRGDYGVGVDPEEQVHRLTTATDRPDLYERMRPDGRVLEIRRNPVPSGGFVLIFSDITDRKRSEAEIRAARDAAEAAYRNLKAAQANLIQAEKMASLGQLTAGIAHEIKNPLNFVNNFAALSVDLLSELKQTAAPGFAVLSEKQRAEVDDVSAMLTSNLEKITEHGKRADGIVKAMLEHSRGSSGERRMTDLNALIDEALNLAYHGARAQDQSFNITLERDFGEGIAPIEVNPQDITRVFLNLFSNGFYAATRRARGGDDGFAPALTVTTRDAGEAVEIRVRDNGPGIPSDIRDKLFQPFFTTKPTSEGTGLGLSITYDIVTKQHGGSIAADSEVGEYSEFTIWLPRSR